MAEHISGKYAIGVCDEGEIIRAVKIFKTRDATHLLAVKKFRLMHGLESQEFTDDLSGLDMDTGSSIDITSDNDSTDIIEISDTESSMISEETSVEITSDITVFNEILALGTEKGTKIALSITEPQLFYSIFDSDWGLKGKKLRSKVLEELQLQREGSLTIRKDAFDLATMTDERVLAVFREQTPRFIDQIYKAKGMYGRRLPTIAFVESAEISLVNIVIDTYEPAEDTVTLILHVGEDHSRFIFLRGKQIYHISEIIGDGADSPNAVSTLYSRLLYDLDNLDISQVNHVVLTGHAYKEGLQDYFDESVQEYFTDTFSLGVKEYFTGSSSSQVSVDPLDMSFMDTSDLAEGEAENLGPYAIAIGAAMRALSGEKADTYNINITPIKVKETQNRLMMSPVAWILLWLLPVILAYSLVEIGNLDRQQAAKSSQIERKRLAASELQKYEDSISVEELNLASYETSFAVIDSLMQGLGIYSGFVTKLMQVTQNIRGIWYTNVALTAEKKAVLVGYSVYRNRIPQLIRSFKTATLNSVEVQEIREKTVYQFEIEVDIVQE